MKKYLKNCFLLLLPIFLWNIILFDHLPKSYGPDIFEREIPKYIVYSENFLRIMAFGLPTLMIFSIKTQAQKMGFSIYIVGLVLYFSSWLAVIIYPESIWSRSSLGFMAPAYTTLIWFIGIGIIGNQAFFRIRSLSIFYVLISALFVFFHTWHTYVVFQKL